MSWASAQPERARPPDFARREAGCVRDVPPCAPYRGVREQLEAIASQQRAQDGFEVVVVLTETPAWAAAAKSGCEPRGDNPEARAPADLTAYRRFAAALLDLARRLDVELRWWSAWNEPNHPGFLNPQRASCDTALPPLAPERYAAMVRALKAELDAQPGDQRLVLGEIAGYEAPRPTAASVTEFVGALPRDVACAGDVWAQHAYVGQSTRGRDADFAGDADLGGSPALIADLVGALDAKRCERPKRIWITETAVGGPRAGKPRPRDAASLAAGCRDMHLALVRWYAHPRIDAAFQYTFREDNFFPVGLVDTALTRTYPTYDLWRAWADREPGDPPPDLPPSCRVR